MMMIKAFNAQYILSLTMKTFNISSTFFFSKWLPPVHRLVYLWAFLESKFLLRLQYSHSQKYERLDRPEQSKIVVNHSERKNKRWLTSCSTDSKNDHHSHNDMQVHLERFLGMYISHKKWSYFLLVMHNVHYMI